MTLLLSVAVKFFLVLASLAVTSAQFEDVCAENTCVPEGFPNATGIEISFVPRFADEEEEEQCVTKCVPARRGKAAVLLGRATCGTECGETTSIVDECLDTEACPNERRGFLVHISGERGCRGGCMSRRRAGPILLRGGSCGACPTEE